MKSTLRKIQVVIFAGLLAGFLLSAELSAGEAAYIRVTATQANVRQTADMTAPVIQTVPKGLVLPVVEKAGEWYSVKLPSGTTGFLHQSVVEEVDESGAPLTKPAAPAVVAPAAKPPAPARQEAPPAKVAAPSVPKSPDAFSMFLARGGFFLAGDSAFKEVYTNGPVFGGELRIGKKKIVGWLEGTYRSRTGEMSYTKEETKVSVMAVEIGALYRFISGPTSPYAGLGLGYYMFKETNDIRGEAAANKPGFCIIGGASFLLGNTFVVDARLKYSTCKMKPADFKIDVGGITAGVGIGIRF